MQLRFLGPCKDHHLGLSAHAPILIAQCPACISKTTAGDKVGSYGSTWTHILMKCESPTSTALGNAKTRQNAVVTLGGRSLVPCTNHIDTAQQRTNQSGYVG